MVNMPQTAYETLAGRARPKLIPIPELNDVRVYALFSKIEIDHAQAWGIVVAGLKFLNGTETTKAPLDILATALACALQLPKQTVSSCLSSCLSVGLLVQDTDSPDQLVFNPELYADRQQYLRKVCELRDRASRGGRARSKQLLKRLPNHGPKQLKGREGKGIVGKGKKGNVEWIDPTDKEFQGLFAAHGEAFTLKEIQKCKDWAKSKGVRRIDWPAQRRNWLKKAQEDAANK